MRRITYKMVYKLATRLGIGVHAHTPNRVTHYHFHTGCDPKTRALGRELAACYGAKMAMTWLEGYMTGYAAGNIGE